MKKICPHCKEKTKLHYDTTCGIKFVFVHQICTICKKAFIFNSELTKVESVQKKINFKGDNYDYIMEGK